MDELNKHGKIGLAAMKSGMDRKTAAKYIEAGQLPSELKKPRLWLTREDPFAEDWPELEAMLSEHPKLDAKTLFEDLMRRRPGRYQEGQLRTLQRRVKRWRARKGPDREVFFPQRHRPGEAMQTDFTWAKELRVTIRGRPFPHMFCHSVLPCSNWEWATVCLSESMSALIDGLQAALFRLGRVPSVHQMDNSTAATHRPEKDKKKRSYNEAYISLTDHFGLERRSISVGKKEQNGDVESSHRVLKRRLDQRLELRGDRDFESREAYERWVRDIVTELNQGRLENLKKELAEMRKLNASRLPSFKEENARVGSGSTIRVKNNTYSVPSRLIGELLRVRIFDDRLEVFHGDRRELIIDRLLGRGGHLINYRHVIRSLVRKPGAFRRYRWREDLFPSLLFRRVYDSLCAGCGEWDADLNYLKILKRAAETLESEVALALELLLEADELPLSDRVKELVEPERQGAPAMAPLQPDLHVYDGLLGSRTGEEEART